MMRTAREAGGAAGGGGFGGRRGMMGGGPPQKRQGSRQAPCAGSRAAPPRPAGGSLAAAAIGSAGVGFTVARAADLGNATNVLFDGLIGKSLPAGTTQAQAEAYLRRSGPGPARADAEWHHRDPGPGHRVRPARRGPRASWPLLFLARRCAELGQGYIMAGVAQRTVSGMRRDVEAKLARLPLQLLRQPPARRRAEPGHQRHRQRDHDPAAEPEPAAHLHAHHPRRAGHDAVDQPAAGADLAGHGADVDRGDLRWSPRRSQKQFAAQWERTGAAEQPRRGDPHRATPWCRCSARSRRTVDDFDRGERGPLRAELPGPVPLRHHPAGDDVHLQPELRRHRRHRRLPGGLGQASPSATSRPSSSTRASSPSRSRRSPA